MTDILLRASIEGTALAVFAWLVTRLIPSLGASARAILWWCVAAKVVVALVWTTPILVPVLPASGNASTQLTAVTVSPADPAYEASTPDVADAALSIGWRTLLLLVWAIGVGIAIALAVRQGTRAAWVLDRATPADLYTSTIAREVADRMRLRRVPPLALSDEVESPLVTGLLRPVVLLPATRFAAMSGEQRRMTVCHELAHIRRRDLWFGCVPALAERVFFFHPLVRLAAREYHFWREAACDAMVIDVLAAPPRAYAELLLELGVCRPASQCAAAGAARSFSMLKRRMLMLSSPSHVTTTRSRTLTGMVVMLGLAAVVPFQLSARPGERVIHAGTIPQTAPAPADDATFQRRDDDDLRFVYFLRDDHTTMSGSSDDMRRARRLKTPGEPMLWFLHDGKEFVVRDRRTLQQLEKIWEPVGRIGSEQGAIGAKQGAIGAKQGEVGARQGLIGAEQGVIGAKQGAIGARQANLAARESRARSDREWQEIARERRDLDQAMRDLDREMAALNEKMREASKPMEELGEQMEDLGAEMEKLGAKMEAASAQARAEMRRLMDRAIADGTAQPVR
jgi:bla regulator protein blaR1